MIHPMRIVGLGGGAIFAGGLAIDALLQATTPPPGTDLIGLLGLPGALLSLTAAFLLGVKAFQGLREGKNPDRAPRYRDIQDIFAGHESADQRRHDALITALNRIEESVDRRHMENMAKLQRIEDLTFGGVKRRER